MDQEQRTRLQSSRDSFEQILTIEANFSVYFMFNSVSSFFSLYVNFHFHPGSFIVTKNFVVIM